MEDRDSPRRPGGEETEFAVSVRAFPATDHDFEAAVHDAIVAEAAVNSQDERLRNVQATLRRIYPNAIVRCQAELAQMFRSERLWYAYRDGRIRKPSQERDRLYELLATARRTSAETAEVLEHSREAARHAKF